MQNAKLKIKTDVRLAAHADFAGTAPCGVPARATAGGIDTTNDVPTPQVAPLNAARTAQARRPYLG